MEVQIDCCADMEAFSNRFSRSRKRTRWGFDDRNRSLRACADRRETDDEAKLQDDSQVSDIKSENEAFLSFWNHVSLRIPARPQIHKRILFSFALQSGYF